MPATTKDSAATPTSLSISTSFIKQNSVHSTSFSSPLVTRTRQMILKSHELAPTPKIPDQDTALCKTERNKKSSKTLFLQQSGVAMKLGLSPNSICSPNYRKFWSSQVTSPARQKINKDTWSKKALLGDKNDTSTQLPTSPGIQQPRPRAINKISLSQKGENVVASPDWKVDQSSLGIISKSISTPTPKKLNTLQSPEGTMPSPTDNKSNHELIAPRHWTHSKLMEWLSKKLKTDTFATPSHVNGKSIMRMTTTQISSVLGLDKHLAGYVYDRIRAENDHIDRMVWKQRVASRNRR